MPPTKGYVRRSVDADGDQLLIAVDPVTSYKVQTMMLIDGDGNILGASGALPINLYDFGVNDTAEVGSVTYVGKEKPDGEWLVLRITEVSATEVEMRYATVTNNPTVVTYLSAWSDYASLSYGTYSVAF